MARPRLTDAPAATAAPRKRTTRRRTAKPLLVRHRRKPRTCSRAPRPRAAPAAGRARGGSSGEGSFGDIRRPGRWRHRGAGRPARRTWRGTAAAAPSENGDAGAAAASPDVASATGKAPVAELPARHPQEAPTTGSATSPAAGSATASPAAGGAVAEATGGATSPAAVAAPGQGSPATPFAQRPSSGIACLPFTSPAAPATPTRHLLRRTPSRLKPYRSPRSSRPGRALPAAGWRRRLRQPRPVRRRRRSRMPTATQAATDEPEVRPVRARADGSSRRHGAGDPGLRGLARPSTRAAEPPQLTRISGRARRSRWRRCANRRASRCWPEPVTR